MKKTLFTLAALMCMTLGLTACGDDNDVPNDGVTVSATYEISFSQDLLDVAEVTIVYVDNKGQVNLDKPTSNRWTRKVSREVKNKAVPVEFGYKLVYALKSNYPDKENYTLTAEGTIKGETPSSSRQFQETLLNGQVGKSRLENAIERGSNKAFGIVVYKEGRIEQNPLFTVFI